MHQFSLVIQSAHPRFGCISTRGLIRAKQILIYNRMGAVRTILNVVMDVCESVISETRSQMGISVDVGLDRESWMGHSVLGCPVGKKVLDGILGVMNISSGNI